MIDKYVTEAGIIVPAVTTGQMREVDRIAIEETGPNLYQMMENAGRNLAELTMRILGKNWQKAVILVLSGTGGNGGGGICAARHLSNRNANVNVCISEVGKLSGVSAYQKNVYQNTEAEIITIDALNKYQPDLIIDAVIGYSLKGTPRGKAEQLIDFAASSKSQIISLDTPSGIDSTSGVHYGKFIKPNLTMTLALPKTGLLPDISGAVYLADIGIPKATFLKLGIKYKNPFEDKFIIPISPIR